MLFVVTGPSGAGKTTLIRQLLEKHPEIKFSISHTTRPPRPGEIDGVDYYFVSEKEFSRLLKKGTFVEWAVVHGHLYGTSRAEFRKSRMNDLILDIDVQGARQIKKVTDDGAVFIFILPPDKDSLEKRLCSRGDLSAEELERRLKRASQEIKSYHLFDYVVINREINQAVEAMEAIVQAERQRRSRLKREIQAILASFKAKSGGRSRWPE